MKNLKVALIVMFVFYFAVLISATLAQTEQSGCGSDPSPENIYCLQLQGTLSVLSLQATLDSITYQSTVAALQKPTSFATLSSMPTLVYGTELTNTPAASVGLPFEDYFDENTNGWEELTQSNGNRARIENGCIALNVNDGNYYWLPIPGLNVSDEFYAEVQAKPLLPGSGTDGRNYLEIGLGLGDALTGQLTAFFATHINFWYVTFWDQTSNKDLFQAAYPDRQFWPADATVTVGLESRGGIYTLYINGQKTEKTRITRYGNNVGIIVRSIKSAQSVCFDNLIVRDAR